ncbi:MAG: hypothetical protein U5L09_13685 [Bacteroidales bacterium]|nr:hypothetical protein [Bacteroidales bacterium]
MLAEGEYTLAVWEDGATNIREEASSQELLTWPNPAKDLVTISLTQNKAGVLQFLDQNGKTISRQNIPAGRSHQRWNTKR